MLGNASGVKYVANTAQSKLQGLDLEGSATPNTPPSLPVQIPTSLPNSGTTDAIWLTRASCLKPQTGSPNSLSLQLAWKTKSHIPMCSIIMPIYSIIHEHVEWKKKASFVKTWLSQLKKEKTMAEESALIFPQMLSSLEWWWENPKCLVFLHFWHHCSDCNPHPAFFFFFFFHHIKRESLDVFQISSQKHFADTIEFSLTKQQSNWHSNITGCRLEWWDLEDGNAFFLHNLNTKQKGILTNQYHM